MSTDSLTDKLRETLDVFDGSPGGEPLTTLEVAESLDPGRRATYERLERLADGDHLKTKKVGAKGRIWWLPRPADDGAEAESSSSVDQRRLETYKQIVETVSDGIYTVDSEGYFTLVNQAFADLTGYPREELLGAHVSKVVDQDTIDTAQAFEQELVEGDRDVATFEADVQTADGSTFRAEGSFTLLQQESGAAERIGVIRDLTARRQAEDELRKSEARFRTMMEQSPFSMQIFDTDGRVLATNSAWERLWDASQEELADYNILEDEQLQAAGITPHLREAFAGEVVTLPITHYDPAEIGKPGRDRWIQGYAYPLQSENGELFEVVLVHHDITERKQRERELELYETIISEARDGVYVLNDFCFVKVNDAYERMTGYDRDELLGSHCSLVIDDDIVEHSAQSLKNIFSGEEASATLEADIQRADGETLRAESKFTGIEDDQTGERKKVGIVRDVSERVKHKRELTKRNERLERFASMLAHELRNPVQIGQIYSRQLPQTEVPDAVEYVREAFDWIEDTIDVMLVLTRGRDVVNPGSAVDLAAVAREAWGGVEMCKATVEITVGTTIQADETYLRHLFRNLFENAIEHGGSDVTVKVGDLPDGFYVEDDGTGIPVEDRDAVFEAGYTTAGDMGGTGLGLAFIKELTTVYEWECTVTESDTGGARFEFTNVDRDESHH